MTNFNTIEELRTKEELINYFKEMGRNITEEEIEELKKSYKQTEENINILKLDQLNKVAGGMMSAVEHKSTTKTGSHTTASPVTPSFSNNPSHRLPLSDEQQSHRPTPEAISQIDKESNTSREAELRKNLTYNVNRDAVTCFALWYMYGGDAPVDTAKDTGDSSKSAMAQYYKSISASE